MTGLDVVGVWAILPHPGFLPLGERSALVALVTLRYSSGRGVGRGRHRMTRLQLQSTLPLTPSRRREDRALVALATASL